MGSRNIARAVRLKEMYRKNRTLEVCDPEYTIRYPPRPHQEESEICLELQFVAQGERGKAKPAIIIQSVNIKDEAKTKVKGMDAYLNEHLTKKNADMVTQVGVLGKQKGIQAIWPRNCTA